MEITFGADHDAVDRVAEQLAGIVRLGVAFSGGVDSATLLALAVRSLGAGRVVALLGVSPSLAAHERAAAHDVARHIGVPVVEIRTREGDRPGYRANGPNRCFHCKHELFSTIDTDVLERHGLHRIAYGENADDVRRLDRPGAQAATQHTVLRPLADAGIDKVAVRRIARALSLPCAGKPAAPCLASRIPHREPVTPAKLAQVEAAEGALRALGFTDSRVRHHGDVARVELPAEEIVRAVTDVREEVLRAGRRRRVPLRHNRPRRDPVGGLHSPARDGGMCLRACPRRRCWPGSRTSTSTGHAAGATQRPSTAPARRPNRSG